MNLYNQILEESNIENVVSGSQSNLKRIILEETLSKGVECVSNLHPEVIKAYSRSKRTNKRKELKRLLNDYIYNNIDETKFNDGEPVGFIQGWILSWIISSIVKWVIAKILERTINA